MKLTDEQIAELAPEWATHYRRRGKVLVFESVNKYQFYNNGSFGDVYMFHYGKQKMTGKPIPRKKFDISEYEFSDSIAEFEVEVCDTLVLKSHGSWFSFDKDDAIALAKHFKLTAEDLR